MLIQIASLNTSLNTSDGGYHGNEENYSDSEQKKREADDHSRECGGVPIFAYLMNINFE